MEQSEESPQQQNIPSGAGQMANSQPQDTHDAVATSYDVSVPVSLTIQPLPPPLVSASQHQLAYQESQDQNLQHRERLRQLWSNEMQEMKPEDLKKHNFSLAPIKRIMKADKDVQMIAKETAVLFAKACEMFIVDLTSQAWVNTEADGRRIVQKKDLAAAIQKTDMYDFLEEVIPRDLKTTNSRQHVGSSTTVPPYNVRPSNNFPQLSIGTSSGSQQPPQFMPWPVAQYQQQPSMFRPQAQPHTPEQQPSLPWPLPHYQQQPYISWPRAQQHTPEQQLYMPWPLPHYQQQPSMPWPLPHYPQQPFISRPQAQQHTSEQQPSMPWPHAQYQQQRSISWPQAQQHTPEQQLSMPWPLPLYHQQPSLPWPLPLYQQQPSMPWPLPHYPHQPFISWPQAQQYTPEQQPSMPWARAQYQQQPSISWPHTPEQQPSMPHTPEQLPILEDELIPDQQSPEQEFLSSPQDEHISDQEQNDN